MATQCRPDLQESTAKQNSASMHIRSEQNCSKIRHDGCDICIYIYIYISFGSPHSVTYIYVVCQESNDTECMA